MGYGFAQDDEKKNTPLPKCEFQCFLNPMIIRCDMIVGRESVYTNARLFVSVAAAANAAG